MAASPKVRKGIGIFCIVAGLFILGTSFIIGFSLNTITGVIVLIGGIINVAKADEPKKK